MQTHIRVLAVLQLIYASVALMLGIGAFLLFGGVATLVNFNAGPQDSLVAVPILAIIGTFAAAFFVVLALPRIIAAVGLLKQRPWARILTMVVNAVGALDFPVGTALAVYAFWVLTQQESAELLEKPATRLA